MVGPPLTHRPWNASTRQGSTLEELLAGLKLDGAGGGGKGAEGGAEGEGGAGGDEVRICSSVWRSAGLRRPDKISLIGDFKNTHLAPNRRTAATTRMERAVRQSVDLKRLSGF